MMDTKLRTWFNVQTRLDVPAYCLKGSDNKFAKFFPMNPVPLKGMRNRAAGAAYYDPKTSSFTLIDTCFGASHTAFGYDKDETLFMSARGVNGIGWINTRVWDETHDAEKSQGWCPAILDYNGDGKIGAYTTENEEPANPKLDRMLASPTGAYAASSAGAVATGYILSVSPVDNSVWYHTTDLIPGRIIRMEVGPNPPQTCMAEVYEPPFTAKDQLAYGPQGIDVDSKGVVWVSLTGSGQAGELRPAEMQGARMARQRPASIAPRAGRLYPVPGPAFKGTDVSADYFYNDWVDRDEHARPRQRRAARHRNRIRLADRLRACDKEMGHAAGSVSDGLLHAQHGWPHRRSQRRLEGPRIVVGRREPRRVAHRGRLGHTALRRALPDAARSPRQMNRPALTKWSKAAGFALGISFFVAPQFAAAQSEWLTWGYDQERTGWNQAETTLNKDNVSHLELKWKSQLSTAPNEMVLSTMTAPLVATVDGPQGPRTLVFVVGSDNTVYAIDSETGKVPGKRNFPNT